MTVKSTRSDNSDYARDTVGRILLARSIFVGDYTLDLPSCRSISVCVSLASLIRRKGLSSDVHVLSEFEAARIDTAKIKLFSAENEASSKTSVPLDTPLLTY